MFHEPGKKLKALAIILFILLSLIPLAMGVMSIFIGVVGPDIPIPVTDQFDLSGTGFIIAGVLLIVFGFLSAWITCISLYTFGAIADDLQTIRRIQTHFYRMMEEKEKKGDASPIEFLSPDEKDEP